MFTVAEVLPCIFENNNKFDNFLDDTFFLLITVKHKLKILVITESNLIIIN